MHRQFTDLRPMYNLREKIATKNHCYAEFACYLDSSHHTNKSINTKATYNLMRTTKNKTTDEKIHSVLLSGTCLTLKWKFLKRRRICLTSWYLNIKINFKLPGFSELFSFKNLHPYLAVRILFVAIFISDKTFKISFIFLACEKMYYV